MDVFQPRAPTNLACCHSCAFNPLDRSISNLWWQELQLKFLLAPSVVGICLDVGCNASHPPPYLGNQKSAFRFCASKSPTPLSMRNMRLRYPLHWSGRPGIIVRFMKRPADRSCSAKPLRTVRDCQLQLTPYTGRSDHVRGNGCRLLPLAAPALLPFVFPPPWPCSNASSVNNRPPLHQLLLLSSTLSIHFSLLFSSLPQPFLATAFCTLTLVLPSPSLFSSSSQSWPLSFYCTSTSASPAPVLDASTESCSLMSSPKPSLSPPQVASRMPSGVMHVGDSVSPSVSASVRLASISYPLHIQTVSLASSARLPCHTTRLDNGANSSSTGSQFWYLDEEECHGSFYFEACQPGGPKGDFNYLS